MRKRCNKAKYCSMASLFVVVKMHAGLITNHLTSNHPDFTYNVSTKDLDSDDVDSDDLDIDDVDSDDSTKEFTEEMFYADSTEAFDKHLGINKDSTRVNVRSVIF